MLGDSEAALTGLRVHANIKMGSGGVLQMFGQHRSRHFISAAVASEASDQIILNLTSTAVTFSAEDFDTDGLHSTSVDPSRLTAALSGIYFTYASIRWAPNSTGNRLFQIHKNSAGVFDQNKIVTQTNTPATATAATVTQTVSGLVLLNAGEHLEAWVFHTSGGDLNLDNSTAAAKLGMAYIGE